MTLTGKTVLVTGGTGFVGGRLVEKLILEQQAHVRVLIRNFGTASRLGRFPVEFIGGEITNKEAVDKAVSGSDFVFHCAHDSTIPRDNQRLTAVQGTLNVCDAVLRHGVQQMVHVSSLAVYGATPDGDLTEESPWPSSDHSYVLAKRATERLVLDQYRERKLPVVVLQPTAVYGPYCQPWTIRPILDLKTGLVPLINGGEGYQNAVYIDDVIDAMFLAAVQPENRGEVFLISGDEPITWKTFYSAFETALGIKSTIEVPEEAIRRELANQAQEKTVSKLINVYPVKKILRTLKRVLSEERRRSLKSRALPISSGNTVQKTNGKSIHIPNEMLLALYRSKTRALIGKARSRLGYNPKFDFGRGMDLTSQFIRWARLAGG